MHKSIPNAEAKHLPHIKAHMRSLPDPWALLSISVQEFPVPDEDRPPLIAFLRGLHQILVGQSLASDVFMQVWKVRPEAGSEILEEHMGEMALTRGIGIWPDREPPSGWTTEALSDASAGLFNGEEMSLPSHRLLRLGCAEPQRQDIAELLYCQGVSIQMYATAPFEELEQQARETYLPTIKEKRFKRARFYMPVMDSASFAAAQNKTELERWLCGVQVYIRESGEDKAVLIASALPLGDLAERAAAVAGIKLTLESLDGKATRNDR